MRMMLLVELDTVRANQLVSEGRLEDVFKRILQRLRPEAAYFYARNGRRAFTLVVDAPDAAALAAVTEPFWLELNASVEAFACMNSEDLTEGLRRIS